MSSDSGIPDSANDKRATPGDAPYSRAEAEPGVKKISRLLADHHGVIDALYAEASNYAWSLPRELFEAALERSAAKRFNSNQPSPEEIQQYLGALHLQDLSLAVTCAAGNPEAWEYFVAAYRPYLRSAAAAILRCSMNSPAARDLADSLFADLYGLAAGKRSERSLFRYFHGRSLLKTWLRAVLAQRHIDAIRSGRRFTELDDTAGAQGDGDAPRRARAYQPVQTPADPNRDRYVALFTRTLHVALGLLDPRDNQRLRLYYAEQHTLAEIGRQLGEHESSVSRNLERIRRELRAEVERALRNPRVAASGAPCEPGLSEAEVSLCFEYASEDAPIDLDKLFPDSNTSPERLEP
jgi:RNA polymerase sigma factor (sigma-70 family)